VKVVTWRVQGIVSQLRSVRGYFTKLLGGTGRGGQAIVSAEAPRDVSRETGAGSILTARIAGVWIVNAAAPDGVGLAEGHPHFDDRLASRLQFFEQLGAHAAALQRGSEPVLVAGDLGVSPTGEEIKDPEHWSGRLGAHERERAALGMLRREGFEDLLVRGTGRPSFGGGLRTDLILCNDAMRRRAVACEVAEVIDLKPAQHAPVSAVFEGIALTGLGPGVLPE